jgi:hypothetical protein
MSRPTSRNRPWPFSLLTSTLTLAFATLPLSAARANRPNPIVNENQHPGSNLWQLPWPNHTVADDIGLQIKGFSRQPATHPGGTIELAVTVTPAQKFDVDVLRLGYYGGLGARLMKHIPSVDGAPQKPCVSDPTTRMLSCPWRTTIEIAIPEHWISGVYVAVMTNAGNFQSLVPFWVVERDRHSELIFLSSLNTYQAYNDYPFDPAPGDSSGLPSTGRSLYPFSSANMVPAVKVSFDRPFSSQYGNPGDGGVFDFEPELIAFLEQSGYDLTYLPDPVLDREPSILLHHKAVVIGGHSEYWTRSARNAMLAARTAGIGLAFISANEIYWQVRYEPNQHGAERRVMVGYKDWAPDPILDPSLRTIRWRDLGLPEQKVVGVQYPTDGNQNWGGQPWVAQNTDHWAYANTGFIAGVALPVEAVGYEIDHYDPTVGPPDGSEYTMLAASPFVNFNNANYTHNSTIYRGSGGNWVWATGSMDWSWTLSPGGSSAGQNNVRPETQIMTRNVLDRMIHEAPVHHCGAHDADDN